MPDHLHAALTHRFEQVFQRGVEMRDLHGAEAIADRFRQFLDAPDDPNSTVESETSSSSSLPSAGAAEASDEPAYLERLIIDLLGKVRVIPVEEIRYITAEDAYVRIHTADDAYLLRKRMHVPENRLDPSAFARVCRSTIIQLDLIEAVHHRSGGDYAVRLETGEELDVSRSRHENLLAQFETGTS